MLHSRTEADLLGRWLVLSLGLALFACDGNAPSPKAPSPSKAGETRDASPAASPAKTESSAARKALLADSRELTARYYPDAKRTGIPVTVRYRARLFDPPETLETTTREAWKPDSPLGAFRGWLPAFVAPDADWIVELFSPEEQETIRERAANPEQLRKNSEFFRRVKAIRVRKIILWGAYAVVEFEHVLDDESTLARPATLVEVDGRWYMTNEAAKNPLFSEILAVLQHEGEEVERLTPPR